MVVVFLKSVFFVDMPFERDILKKFEEKDGKMIKNLSDDFVKKDKYI